MLKVEGHSHLYRDPKSNAIVNTNKDQIKAAKLRRKLAQAERDRINRLEEKVDRLTELMEALLNGSNK